MKINIMNGGNLLDPTDLFEGQVFKDVDNLDPSLFYAFVNYYNDDNESSHLYDSKGDGRVIVSERNFAQLVLFNEYGLQCVDVNLVEFAQWKINPLEIVEISVRG